MVGRDGRGSGADGVVLAGRRAGAEGELAAP